MITFIVVFVVLYLVVGIALTIFIFSQFPFIDYGPHFILLWPIVAWHSLHPIAVIFLFLIIIGLSGLISRSFG